MAVRVPANHPAILQAYREGRIIDPGPARLPTVANKPKRNAIVVPGESVCAGDFDADEPWVTVTVPIKTVNRLNGGRGLGDRIRRPKIEREATALSLIGVPAKTWAKLAEGCVVSLTRISPRKLDPSNIWAALKSVQDQVAVMLFGGNPGQYDYDPRVTWDEPQQLISPKRGVYGVIVSIRVRR